MSEAKELIASIYDLFNSPEEIRWVVSSKNREELYRKLVKGGTPNVFDQQIALLNKEVESKEAAFRLLTEEFFKE